MPSFTPQLHPPPRPNPTSMAADETPTSTPANDSPTAAMAQPQPFPFDKLPLELQQHVFRHVSARPGGAAANMLRRWFEKKEVKEVIAADTTGDTLVARYWDDSSSDSDSEDSVSDDNDSEEDSDEDDDDDGDEDEDDNKADGDDGDDSDTDGEDASDMDNEDAAPVRFVRPHAKWRHISNFLRISECPPPVALLQTSKTMQTAAMDWFYEVTVMEIDATGSFAHTSMFETALDEITAADYTLFKIIRKVKLLFVWDSEWLRGPVCNGMASFFEQVLFVRVYKILEVLDQTMSPCLSDLRIEWHDSVQDGESTAFKDNICALLATLPVTFTHKEPYLMPGETPAANSLIGRKRMEFKAIADRGFNLM